LKMPKNKLAKIMALIAIITLISVGILTKTTSAFISQNSTTGFTISDTTITATAIGDVNGDGLNEIVTAGYFNNGVNWVAKLQVLNAATLAVQSSVTWVWGTSTQVTSLAVANITGNKGLEIITGGAFFDGTNWVAQLQVWNGTNLAFENVVTWLWYSGTQISSLAVGDVDGDGKAEIVTVGNHYDGTRWVAQLHTWNATTLAFENLVTWRWGTDMRINSVAVANISQTTGLDIVTGGEHFDGTRWTAQVHVWRGTTLAYQNSVIWQWGTQTDLNSVAIANITGGTSLSIITAGDFYDGTRWNAQIQVWNANTLAFNSERHWFTVGDTTISSVAVGNYTGGTSLDIVTGGHFNDTLRNNAEIADLNGSTLASLSYSSWWTTSNTEVYSVQIGVIPSFGNRVISGGETFDGTRANSQVTIWA